MALYLGSVTWEDSTWVRSHRDVIILKGGWEGVTRALSGSGAGSRSWRCVLPKRTVILWPQTDDRANGLEKISTLRPGKEVDIGQIQGRMEEEKAEIVAVCFGEEQREGAMTARGCVVK